MSPPKSNRVCEVRGCGEKHRANGLCKHHYDQRARRTTREQRAADAKAVMAERAKSAKKPRPKTDAPQPTVRRWWEEPSPPPATTTTPGDGYSSDNLGAIPLARPIADRELTNVTRLLTRLDALDLAPMLGVTV